MKIVERFIIMNRHRILWVGLIGASALPCTRTTS
jgi:hypothetical protein